MHDDRLAPGEYLHDGAPRRPRPAAAIMLLRGGHSGLEVLLARRTLSARFMGGAWVFPGGALDARDGTGQDGLEAAARRELGEEVGIALPAGSELVAFARWITPARLRTRFDTWFYLALAPANAKPLVDGSEIVAARWITPAGALAGRAHRELLLAFPTIRQLQQLAEFPSTAALLSYAASHTVEPVQPQITGSGAGARIVLPGEAGYV